MTIRAELPDEIQAIEDDILPGDEDAGEESNLMPGGIWKRQLRRLTGEFKVNLVQPFSSARGNKPYRDRMLRVSRLYLHRLLRLRPDSDTPEDRIVQSIDSA